MAHNPFSGTKRDNVTVARVALNIADSGTSQADTTGNEANHYQGMILKVAHATHVVGKAWKPRNGRTGPAPLPAPAKESSGRTPRIARALNPCTTRLQS
ncbi:hypothetical protein MAPG_00557 [Magnaporthiopsis poae ATCC 64411]|uniref:Uncharacterized protein n=1 Tax=Magnaporthiopsis poae (strain ATCC 64411 / 73-15) TaxID=644358 RepID=A0A0C4DLB6_MAGP6|nr:hypothetical protein MAPG_00557 [Magnaporthiopsis poae ATCC 64411]